MLLMRDVSLARYPGDLTVRSRVLGDFTVPVPASSVLAQPVDVLWVATKAGGLEAAVAEVRPEQVGGAVVIPLLNGIDHVARLRERYPKVVAGALRVESARDPDWTITVGSPFVRMELAGAADVAATVRAAGIACTVVDDEMTLLWQKLVFLAPLALATTAAGGPLGEVKAHSDLDQDYREAGAEALLVGQAEGAAIDVDALAALRAAAPDTMRSSMERDVAEGRPPELDAIAGPILAAATRHGIPAPATERLVARVRQRLEAAAPDAVREVLR